MSYQIKEIIDGKEAWHGEYNNCIEAVLNFNKFTDASLAQFGRLIYLIEPSGKTHAKYFTRKP